MSLSPHERDAAFVFYSLAYGGTQFFPPLVYSGDEFHAAVDPPILAAAIQLGAGDRANAADPLRRHEVAEAVEHALSEEPAPSSAPDAIEARIVGEAGAYADGRGEARAEELASLEAWTKEPDAIVTPGGVRGWIAARRASAPTRGMTAAEVLHRIAAWRNTMNRDADCVHVWALCDKIRRELEGGAR